MTVSHNEPVRGLLRASTNTDYNVRETTVSFIRNFPGRPDIFVTAFCNLSWGCYITIARLFYGS